MSKFDGSAKVYRGVVLVLRNMTHDERAALVLRLLIVISHHTHNHMKDSISIDLCTDMNSTIHGYHMENISN